MKVRDLLAQVGPDAEILVMYDEREDELAIHRIDEGAVIVNSNENTVTIDLRWYAKDIYVDCDQ